jgi:aspartyl-tRNA(Asn)/glutamyl-tRNA(Gln) amidotransferase subunit C
MAKVSIKDVEHVAKLARLGLSEEEKVKFTDQLGKILDYAEQINALDTEKVPPTTSPFPLKNVLREDKVVPCDDIEAIIKNGPEVEEHMFLVPRMFE